MSDSIAKQAVRGGALVGGAQAVKAVIQFISVIVLARLLMPGDFGLIAAVAPVIALVGLMQDFGLRQGIAQRTDLPDEQINRAFWMLFWIGLTLALLMAAASPLVAAFYGAPELVLICLASALTIFIWSLSSIPMALITRQLRFGALAVLEVAAALAGLLVAAGCAMAGARYWSLVIGTGTSGAVMAVGGWLVAGWRPGRITWRLPDREMMAFGANLTGFNLVNFLARNLDNVLIGRFAGIEQLGLYDRAYKLLLFPIQNVMWPLTSVAVPILARMKQDPAQFRETYLMGVGLLAFGIIPGIAAVAATAPEMVAILFGPQWAAVAPILFWLCLAGLAHPVLSSTGWVFLSQGRSDQMLRLGVFCAASAVASFVVGLPWGAAGVAMAYAITEFAFRLPLTLWWVGRLGPVTMRDMVSVQLPLLLAAVVTIGVSHRLLRSDLQGLHLVVVTFALSYALALAATLSLGSGRRRLALAVTWLRRR